MNWMVPDSVAFDALLERSLEVVALLDHGSTARHSAFRHAASGEKHGEPAQATETTQANRHSFTIFIPQAARVNVRYHCQGDTTAETTFSWWKPERLPRFAFSSGRRCWPWTAFGRISSGLLSGICRP